MDDNKAKALTAALAQIEKQFGKGSIMRMGDSLSLIHILTIDQFFQNRHSPRVDPFRVACGGA